MVWKVFVAFSRYIKYVIYVGPDGKFLSGNMIRCLSTIKIFMFLI